MISTGIDDFMSGTLQQLVSPHTREVVNERTNSRTKEKLFFDGIITNPKDRIIRNKARKHNLVAQIAETAWVLMGSSEIRYISPFLPRAIDFSDNGLTWRAGYGSRIRKTPLNINWDFFCQEEGNPEPISGIFDQVTNVISVLKNDPSSRQAYIIVPIHGDNFTSNKTKDTPCTVFIQFLIRDNRLHCSVKMRSNDCIWGSTGINIFEWTFLQEIIASILEVEVGVYNHNATSMHIYERHFNRATEIISASKEVPNFDLNQHVLLKPNSLLQVDNILQNYLHTFENIEESDDTEFHLEEIKTFFSISEQEHTNLEEYFIVPLLELSSKTINKTEHTEQLRKYYFKQLNRKQNNYIVNSLKESKYFLNIK